MSWRGEARKALRDYPRIKKRQSLLTSQQITPVYGGAAVQHSASRTTEDVALRTTLTEREENIVGAVEFMLNMQQRYANSAERLRMVELVYFKHTHTIDGAADIVHYSPDALWRWNGEILTAVYVGLKKR